MVIVTKKLEVKQITISGDDLEGLKNLCEVMEGVAQTVIDGEPDKLIKVQNTITFCRKILGEFK
jgi:hypothetical protein